MLSHDDAATLEAVEAAIDADDGADSLHLAAIADVFEGAGADGLAAGYRRLSTLGCRPVRDVLEGATAGGLAAGYRWRFGVNGVIGLDYNHEGGLPLELLSHYLLARGQSSRGPVATRAAAYFYAASAIAAYAAYADRHAAVRKEKPTTEEADGGRTSD